MLNTFSFVCMMRARNECRNRRATTTTKALILYTIFILSHMNNNYGCSFFGWWNFRRTPIWIFSFNFHFYSTKRIEFNSIFVYGIFFIRNIEKHTHLWFDFNDFFVETRMDDFFGHFVIFCCCFRYKLKIKLNLNALFCCHLLQ